MSYLGSKAASGAFQAIIGTMPPHQCYVEAFVGTGVIAQRKPRASLNVLIERSYDVLGAVNVPGALRVCADALELLPAMRWELMPQPFLYLDPPYLHESRGHNRYRYELEGSDHVRLLEFLQGFGYPAMVSCYPNELYSEYLAGWRVRDFQVMTRGGPRVERIHFNYSPGAIVVSNYVGSNFTDRQRIKRKVDRWVSRYRGLPQVERDLILARLLQIERS